MIYDVQKASVTKRFAAFLLDIILIACLAVGFMALIAVICKYDTHYKNMQSMATQVQKEVVETYKQQTGFDLNMSSEEYDALTEEQKTQVNELRTKAGKEITEKLNANSEFMKEYKYINGLTPLMVSIGVFLSVLIFEFIIPVAFKNGQTIGKKVFGLAVMHTNGVRVRPFSMFVRSILGMYVFEMMVPIYLILMAFFYHVLSGYIAIGVIVAIVILQIAVFAYTFKSTASVLHDLIARTVCVDFSSQMIFDSEEELMEFKKAQQNELAERDEYREGKKFDFYNSSLNRRNGRKIVDENGKEIVYDDEKKEESAPSGDTSQSESISVADENGKTNGDAKKHTKRKKTNDNNVNL